MKRQMHPSLSPVGPSLRRIVAEQPGIHFRGLARAANVVSTGQLRHHLDRLRREGVLIEVADGRYRRYFVSGDQKPALRPGLAHFARAVPRRIARLLLVHPLNRTELRRSLGCADSTLGYHLRRMLSLGDVQKTPGPNCCHYSLTDCDMVRQVLEIQDHHVGMPAASFQLFAARNAPADVVPVTTRAVARPPGWPTIQIQLAVDGETPGDGPQAAV
ncbi:MAG: winged helix-turn-helix transcriptional regulator [Thermoplasmatota archaeon]